MTGCEAGASRGPRGNSNRPKMAARAAVFGGMNPLLALDKTQAFAARRARTAAVLARLLEPPARYRKAPYGAEPKPHHSLRAPELH